MILAKPMKRCLELVRMFNGLERDQLYFFLKKEFPKRNPNLDMNRILRMRLIYEQDNIFHLPYTESNPYMREAVQVLQDFWSRNIIGFNKGNHPVMVMFSKLMKGKARKFYVCRDENVSDLRLCEDNAVVIIITADKDFHCPHLNDYVIAVKEDGKYNYYRTQEVNVK